MPPIRITAEARGLVKPINPAMKPLLLLTALLMIGGCATVSESFPGRDPDQVWTALVAVAETPSYDDDDPTKRWWVKENRVWVDEANARIEIYRELDRMLRRGTSPPLRQERTWRFQIVLDAEGPTATFTSRGVGVPMRAVAEGNRYFTDVHALLDGTGQPEPGTEAGNPASEGAGDDVIDIDALEPD